MKKVIAIGLTAALLLSFSASWAENAGTANGSAQAGAAAQAIPDTAQNTVKDETVYLSLDAEGNPQSIQVVNHLETPEAGVYTDYGSYSALANLTGSEQPETGGGKITWKLPAREGGFYYQGTLDSAEAPFSLSVGYTLDGAAIAPDELAGKAGKVAITLSVKANPGAADYFKENYVCQLQAPLDMDVCQNIRADGATMAITGKTATLTYMVMPGNDASYTVSFDTGCFSFAGVTAACSYYNFSSMLDMDVSQIAGGVGDLQDGMGRVVDGTAALKTGLSSLNSGVAALAGGASGVADGATQLAQGADEYAAGVQQAAGGASQLAGGLNALAAQNGSITGGYQQLQSGISQSLEQLITQLPAELRPVVQQQAAALQTQMETYGAGLNAYTAGVAQGAQGAQQLSDGLGALPDGAREIQQGAQQLSQGAQQLSGSLDTLAGRTRSLPSQVQKLVDGQTQIKDGVDQAAELLSGASLPSNTDTEKTSFLDGRNQVRTVQFVIKTAEIAAPALDNTPPSQTDAEPQGFWQRLKALFS